MKKNVLSPVIVIEHVERMIYVIRGNKVLIDRDLALLYGVETKALIQAVKRNIERFPGDFMFQLTKEEIKNLISQFVTSNSSRSQIVTLKRGQNIKYLPYAFTEQGVAMLSTVLRSPQAILINIEIMRAFIRMRQILSNRGEMSKELTELKSFLLKHSNSNDREFKRIWQTIEKMAKSPDDKEQRKIGFDIG